MLKFSIPGKVAPRLFTWSKRAMQFSRDGQPVKPAVVKAASNAATKAAALSLQERTHQLVQDAAENKGFTVAQVNAWRADAKQALKIANAANEALGRGGIDNMSAQAWERAAARLERPFAAIDRVAERMIRGGYGPELDNGQLRTHVFNINASGRSAFENARLDLAVENEHDEFKRLLGASDNCTSNKGFTGCIEAANMGWVSRDEFIEIGGCSCHDACNCTFISRNRAQIDALNALLPAGSGLRLGAE